LQTTGSIERTAGSGQLQSSQNVLFLLGSVETQLGLCCKFCLIFCSVFIPVSTGIKSIKIDQEMPEL